MNYTNFELQMASDILPFDKQPVYDVKIWINLWYLKVLATTN